MNRLSARLVFSHLLVAVAAALASYVVVRLMAPALFDATVLHELGPGRQGLGPGSGQGAGQVLRESFAAAVNTSLLVGTGVGVLIAAIVGTFAAYRLLRPLGRVGEVTRRMAAGNYGEQVELPREKELADLVTDVNRLGNALEDTETTRVRLLSEVAHEMRTPLTVIDGYVEGMIDEVIATTPDELGKVGDEVRRLRRLTDDLSALSRAAEHRLDLRPELIDVAETTSAAAERLRVQAQDAGVELSLNARSRVPAMADRDRLSQVVTNLIGNALRATPPGGRIDVSVTQDDARALIQVADTGDGLAEADLGRVFERFYRVPGRRVSGTDTGSGIGLTIARDLRRAQGGGLEAASAGIGRGATFTAWLPAAA
jgi:histidine kinase